MGSMLPYIAAPWILWAIESINRPFQFVDSCGVRCSSPRWVDSPAGMAPVFQWPWNCTLNLDLIHRHVSTPIMSLVYTIIRYIQPYSTIILWYISADPGLRQGRGGAWDHRRCGSCLSWTLAKATTRPQQWLKSTIRPQQWLLIGVQGCRLPGLKPSKPSNSSKSLPNSAGKRYPNKPNTRHARRQKPPQGHSNGSRAPSGRSNGFL